MKEKLLIAYLLGISSFIDAQDVTGFWKGTLDMRGGCFPVNNIELQISPDGNNVYGNSYHYLDINYYVKKKFNGSNNAGLKKLIIQEGIVTTFKIPSHCRVCIKKYDLTYSKNGDKEILSGEWTGKTLGSNTTCGSGPIILSRIKESAFKEIPEVLVDTGEIRLDFYDNAEIDGDSITVLVNKKVLLSHQKLGAKPLTLFVKIDPQNTFQEVEMVAENLGTIPPNTAVLIITAGEKRYRLFLLSTQTKSAVVRFVYDKEGALKNKRITE